MERYYELAGKLIDFYREKTYKNGNDDFTIRMFCLNKDGSKICSYPTYKRLSTGKGVMNTGFYYVLCDKLGLPFEVPYALNGDAIPNFENQLVDLMNNQKMGELKSFLDYYAQFFEVLPPSIVTNEYKDITSVLIQLIDGNKTEFDIASLEAIASVSANTEFVKWLKYLTAYYIKNNLGNDELLSTYIEDNKLDGQDVFRMTSFLSN